MVFHNWEKEKEVFLLTLPVTRCACLRDSSELEFSACIKMYKVPFSSRLKLHNSKILIEIIFLLRTLLFNAGYLTLSQYIYKVIYRETYSGFPGGPSSEEFACQGRRHRRHGSILRLERTQGPWPMVSPTVHGVTESDTTEHTCTHIHA